MNDPSIFIYYRNEEQEGVIYAHVEDFIFGGMKLFIKKTTIPFWEKFSLGLEAEKVF